MGNSNIRCPAAKTVGKSNSRIRREIERWLDHIKNPSGSSLFIRLCMIGRKGEKTNPTITIFCASRETSKIFEASVRQSGILDRYPGLQMSSSALPLDASLVPRPLFDRELQAGGPDTSTVKGNAPKTSKSGVGCISGPRMGRRLEFIIASEAGPSVQHATGGLIVRIGNELYQITSFDSTGNAMESNLTSKVPRDPEKCEFDRQLALEDSGYEQVFTSDESLLLETRLEQDEKPRFYGQRPPDLTKPYPCEVVCSPLPGTGGGIEHSLMWKDQGNAIATQPATKPITAGQIEKSHYTLVKLSELEYSEASNVVLGGDGQVPPKLEAVDVARVGTEHVGVLVVTSRGPVSGIVLPDMASLRLGSSSHFQAVHPVILSEPGEPGDRGSAVIDAETGSCYGHIIHGVEGDVVCYMVPASDTLADIVNRLGRLPSLQLDQRNDTKHSNTVERWKCVNPRGDTNCRPLAPLGKCMSCSSGKLYRARSRAAAHLRRKHFPGKAAGQHENIRRAEDVRHNRPPATELKKWTREIAVTPLYARVMQAESDSDSDYDDDLEDSDDESEPEPSSATSTNITDHQANFEMENEDLRRHNEKMKHEIETLEDDVDVLMEDREELKQELDHLRRRLQELEEAQLVAAQQGPLLRLGCERTEVTKIGNVSEVS